MDGTSQRPRSASSVRSASSTRSSSTASSTASKRSTGPTYFPCNNKHRNPLPEIPFDAKLLPYPFQANRHYRFNLNDQEFALAEYDHQASYSDLGMANDLVQFAAFQKLLLRERRERGMQEEGIYNPARDPYDSTQGKGQGQEEEDEELFHGFEMLNTATSSSTASSGTPLLRNLQEQQVPKRKHQIDVPWLRRTQYISSKDRLYGHGNQDKAQKFKKMKQTSETDITALKKPEGQIAAIEKTFSYVSSSSFTKDLKHPTNPSLTATEVMPIFPDFETWSHNLMHFVFPDNPDIDAPFISTNKDKKLSPERRTMLEEALFRPMADPYGGKQYLGYFLPNKESTTQLHDHRKRLHEDEEYEEELSGPLTFQHVRDYDYEVVDGDKEERSDKIMMRVEGKLGAFYRPFDKTTKLKRKRLDKNTPKLVQATKLIVSYRDYTPEEKETQKLKLGEIMDERDVQGIVG